VPLEEARLERAQPPALEHRAGDEDMEIVGVVAAQGALEFHVVKAQPTEAIVADRAVERRRVTLEMAARLDLEEVPSGKGDRENDGKQAGAEADGIAEGAGNRGTIEEACRAPQGSGEYGRRQHMGKE
jgi:hypothetical protein